MWVHSRSIIDLETEALNCVQVNRRDKYPRQEMEVQWKISRPWNEQALAMPIKSLMWISQRHNCGRRNWAVGMIMLTVMALSSTTSFVRTCTRSMSHKLGRVCHYRVTHASNITVNWCKWSHFSRRTNTIASGTHCATTAWNQSPDPRGRCSFREMEWPFILLCLHNSNVLDIHKTCSLALVYSLNNL